MRVSSKPHNYKNSPSDNQEKETDNLVLKRMRQQILYLKYTEKQIPTCGRVNACDTMNKKASRQPYTTILESGDV